MEDRFPYGKRNWYPHMKPYDVALWDRFISQFPDVYDECSYDVGVGSVPDHALEPIIAEGGTAEQLYKRKIDVVGYKADQIDIIEVKPNAGLSAIGQVVGYRILYVRDFAPSVTPKCVIVTDRTDENISHAAYAQGVQIVVV